ncbi:hypothetical protein TEA_004094 [Camellia sinensis var. sinensis]|uniref:ATPase AAA-type core domain-containing protein n=1 Tax=Camellia sinensis var. sinensis TaxID=542762 RepID=A0A4V3WPL0_CAMSN|nr:hypothetical protein TEA_004094 [Camellia sinensis var. sinensis]
MRIFRENQLYRKVYTYLNSLATIEDSISPISSRGKKSMRSFSCLDDDQTVHDEFLRAECRGRTRGGGSEAVHETRNLMIRETERWRSFPFTHPSTLDTIAMDLDLKIGQVRSRIVSQIQTVLSRLGRVWRRSYLLYGPSGTGKSSFIAAHGKFPLLRCSTMSISGEFSDDSDLKMLLLQTKNKSVIVIEDLDRFMVEKIDGVELSGVLNFKWMHCELVLRR